MAVVQHFTIGHPVVAESSWVLTREQAEELYVELREALGYSGWAQEKVVPPVVTNDSTPMSPEEYLASRQALEALEQGREAHSHATRSSGSGIGVMDPNH